MMIVKVRAIVVSTRLAAVPMLPLAMAASESI
jgi:hypothetical protein